MHRRFWDHWTRSLASGFVATILCAVLSPVRAQQPPWGGWQSLSDGAENAVSIAFRYFSDGLARWKFSSGYARPVVMDVEIQWRKDASSEITPAHVVNIRLQPGTETTNGGWWSYGRAVAVRVTCIEVDEGQAGCGDAAERARAEREAARREAERREAERQEAERQEAERQRVAAEARERARLEEQRRQQAAAEQRAREEAARREEAERRQREEAERKEAEARRQGETGKEKTGSTAAAPPLKPAERAVGDAAEAQREREKAVGELAGSMGQLAGVEAGEGPLTFEMSLNPQITYLGIGMDDFDTGAQGWGVQLQGRYFLPLTETRSLRLELAGAYAYSVGNTDALTGYGAAELGDRMEFVESQTSLDAMLWYRSFGIGGYFDQRAYTLTFQDDELRELSPMYTGAQFGLGAFDRGMSLAVVGRIGRSADPTSTGEPAFQLGGRLVFGVNYFSGVIEYSAWQDEGATGSRLAKDELLRGMFGVRIPFSP